MQSQLNENNTEIRMEVNIWNIWMHKVDLNLQKFINLENLHLQLSWNTLFDLNIKIPIIT